MTMLDQGVFNANPYHTFHHARFEAMNMLERALAEGSTEALEALIHTYIALDPPPLDLLRHIADDMTGRLLMLREQMLERPAYEHDCAIIETIHSLLTDWLRGLSTRAVQRAAFQRAAILPLGGLPDEHFH
ncbi:MAG: hypothetical protein SF162_03245 [bacterium]|nr:hypothetical protein [bacterium]